jgi:hypothetical protein
MYLLSTQARELIEEAVNALPDAERRELWHKWANQNRRVRLPDGPVRDDEPPMPENVALVALSALKEMEDSKRNLRASREISEDELSDLDNDLTYIRSLTRLLQDVAFTAK